MFIAHINRDSTKFQDHLQDAFKVNHLAIIVTSNSLASVPVEPDDRRATVMRVGDSRRQDHAYFTALNTAWVNGSRKAFIEFLQQRDVRQFNPRKPHPTPEKAEVASATADLATAYWAHVLEDGLVPGEFSNDKLDWNAGPVFLPVTDNYAGFIQFAHSRGQRLHLPQPAELHERLGQLCPSRGKQQRPRKNGVQGPRGREYPHLAQCRAEMERALKGAATPLSDPD